MGFMLHSLVPFSAAGLNIMHSTRNDDLPLRLSGPAHSLAIVPARAGGHVLWHVFKVSSPWRQCPKVYLNRELAGDLIYLLRLRCSVAFEGWRVRMADRDLLAR